MDKLDLSKAILDCCILDMLKTFDILIAGGYILHKIINSKFKKKMGNQEKKVNFKF